MPPDRPRPAGASARQRSTFALDPCVGLGLGLGLGLWLGLAGCEQRYWVCDEHDERTAELPRRLSETGLFVGPGTDELAPGVRPYEPRFTLWSDGAEKRRWIRLPPGARIDSADQDAWRFPEDTRLWKEFSRDGLRLETRVLWKRGPGDDDWIDLSYLWDADQRDATAIPTGAVDVAGTTHDVPAAGECRACHGGRASHVLGFAAIQLAAPAPAADGTGLDLQRLLDEELLTVPPPTAALVVPGDDTERRALGYLHANCGHCHNQARPPGGASRCFDPLKDFDFGLQVARLATVDDTPTYQTMAGAVEPGHPEDSELIDKISDRGMFRQMPPLGTEEVDRDAVTLLTRWVSQLEARP